MQKHSSGLLVALDVEGREVLVVGAGAVASRKAARVLEAGARVRVVSPPPMSDRMEALRERFGSENLVFEARTFEPGDVDGKALVFAATNDLKVNEMILATAKSRGVLVNSATVTSGGARADFSLLARVEHVSRGELEVGVHTAGGAPALSAAFSERLASLLDEEELAWGVMAPLLSCMRPMIKSKGDGRGRRAFWRALIGALLELPVERWRGDRVFLVEVISEAAERHGIELSEAETAASLDRLGWF